jgi:hypothetical protein
MARIQKNENQIIIKGNTPFFSNCLASVIMFFCGVSIFLKLPVFHGDYGIIDVCAAIFLLLWIIGVICLGTFYFINLNKKIIIDPTGVTCICAFVTKHYEWLDIKDYGIFTPKFSWVRTGKMRYDFYFSKTKQDKANECNKKQKGGLIKVLVFGVDCAVVAQEIIPYCEKYSIVPPFIGEGVQ